MKKTLLVMLIAAASLAQTPAPPGPRGAQFGAYPTLRSPEVMTDARVTFRHRAPDARTVFLVPEPGQRTPMIQGSDGIWTVTIGPLTPDIYAYRFDVDGIP